MAKSLPLLPEGLYHIYTRGIDRRPIFHTSENYRHFLRLYAHHVSPVVDSFAYCLLPNHFHFFVRIRIKTEIEPAIAWGRFLMAYAKGFNQRYQRTGSLFEHPFKRKQITDNSYHQASIRYIHHNPVKHGLVSDSADWQWSSYRTLLSQGETRLEREQVLDWFGGRDHFINFHRHHEDPMGFENPLGL